MQPKTDNMKIGLRPVLVGKIDRSKKTEGQYDHQIFAPIFSLVSFLKVYFFHQESAIVITNSAQRKLSSS